MAMEEEVTDIIWEKMKTFAKEQQQYLYEFLSEYIIYKSDEHKYLKQNIGYALFGPPKDTNDASAIESNCYYNTEHSNTDTDVTDTVDYDEEAKKVINKIYDQICNCVGIDDSEPICFGTIYNIIFRPKTNVMLRKEEEEKMEVKEEEKNEEEMEIKEEEKNEEMEVKEGEEKNEEKEDEEKLFIVSSVPIFKIRKSIQKKSAETTESTEQENTAESVETLYETWYIDSNARVYKNWADYIENNNLPECTMVLPKDGVYQPDLTCPATEDYSTVWLEIMESPACTWKTKICNGIDIASNIVGFGTVGLGVVSLFTPLAPVVLISGLAAAGVAGVWSIGRNSQQLIDRSSHEESIHVLDKEAFPHYLGIAGTAFGLGTIGGSAIISNVAARGLTVNTFARVAFNTVQGGNLIINGVGIIYQGYNMIDKYKTEKTVSVVDALNLATHLMFFCGSVVKVQFASDIIESTQGRVMNEYKESLSTKRLRKNFNRAMRKAAQNNTCKMSEGAEVIRYIRNRQELLSNQSVTNSDNSILKKTSRNIIWSYEHGRLKVNGIELLDPIKYVKRLIGLGINIFVEIDQSNSSSPRNYANDSTADQLTKLLCDLLSKLYLNDDCPTSTRIPIVPDFELLIREMSSMNINENYFKKMFEIAVQIVKRFENMKDLLSQSFIFIWQYCKENLKQWGINSSYYIQSNSRSRILRMIISTIYEAVDTILDDLFIAFASLYDVQFA